MTPPPTRCDLVRRVSAPGARGRARCARFLTDYDPERRDFAATSRVTSARSRALEELWLGEPARAHRRARTLPGPPRSPRAARAAVHGAAGSRSSATCCSGSATRSTIPLSFKYLFDTIIPDGSLRRLGVFVAVLLAIFAANAVVTVRRSYVTALVNQRVLFGLQERMFERLQRLSHGFYGRAKVGDLMSRLSQDLNTVQEATTQRCSREGVFLVLSARRGRDHGARAEPAARRARADRRAALRAQLRPAPALALREASLEVRTVYGQVAASMQENLSAHAVVKALGLEERALGRTAARLGGLLRAIVRVVAAQLGLRGERRAWRSRSASCS